MDEDLRDTHFSLYIGTLLFKSMDRQPLTDKERQDLEAWLDGHPRRRERLLRSMDRDALMKELQLLQERYDPVQAADDLFQTLGLSPSAGGRSYRTKRRRLFISGAVAAAALTVAVAIWILAPRREKRIQEVPVAGGFTNDVQPGNNKAILTLSDGSSIVLDSARRGTLTRQGGAEVTNSNGQLSYQAPGAGGGVVYNTMRTLRGGRYQLTLPDGTHIWLNAESSVRFPSAFTGSRREVEISGEAYLEVASAQTDDGRRPFVVKIHSPSGKDAEVQVLGTHFNVMAYDNESALETTLLEGAVLFNKGKDTVLLRPGQQGRWTESAHMQRMDGVDVESVVAWKNGLQSFHKADIPAIMRHVERWYDVKVRYQGSEPSALTFSGEVPNDVNLSQLLKVFETPALHFDIDGVERKVTVIYHPK